MRIKLSGLRRLLKELIANDQLDVPHYEQQEDWSCGPGAAREVLLYYGIDIPEKQLIPAMNATSENGTEPDDLTAFLNSVPGISAEMKQMTVPELFDCVDSGVPVIVDLQANTDNEHTDYRHDYNDGHYVVLTGYKGDKLLFSDPGTKTQGDYLPVDDLIDRWHDLSSSGPVQNLGIIVRKTQGAGKPRPIGGPGKREK